MTNKNKSIIVECYNFIMMHSAATSDPELRKMLGMTDEHAAQIASLAIDASLAKIITTYLPNTSDALAFVDKMKSHSTSWVNEILESTKSKIEGGI